MNNPLGFVSPPSSVIVPPAYEAYSDINNKINAIQQDFTSAEYKENFRNIIQRAYELIKDIIYYGKKYQYFSNIIGNSTLLSIDQEILNYLDEEQYLVKPDANKIEIKKIIKNIFLDQLYILGMLLQKTQTPKDPFHNILEKKLEEMNRIKNKMLFDDYNYDIGVRPVPPVGPHHSRYHIPQYEEPEQTQQGKFASPPPGIIIPPGYRGPRPTHFLGEESLNKESLDEESLD
jgi:hypothetical protein